MLIGGYNEDFYETIDNIPSENGLAYSLPKVSINQKDLVWRKGDDSNCSTVCFSPFTTFTLGICFWARPGDPVGTQL